MSVELTLLGTFEVRIDGRVVPDDGWRRRQAAALVKLLALAPGRQLHREQVIDAFWPDLGVDEAAPRLHKAAHFARKATGEPDTIVLQGDRVALFPGVEVTIDALRFDELAARALGDRSPEAASAAADLYRGDLLPQDLYEPWADDERERLRLRQLELLKLARRWDDLLALDPTDEDAHLAVMRDRAAQADRRGALRQFERMDRALRRELGVGPSDAALALRDELLAELPEPSSSPSPATTGLVGREAEMDVIARMLQQARAGQGRTLFVSGPAGIGKSSLLAAVASMAGNDGWRVGRGTASAIEGAWPYAPVLEAVADLGRRHPALLERLDPRFKHEIDRALVGEFLDLADGGGHQRLFVATCELLRLAAADGGALLLVDDLQDADEASLRLLHYLARSSPGERVMLALGHRSTPLPPDLDQVRTSLLGRGTASELCLEPLDRGSVATLLARQLPDPPSDLIDHVVMMSGGLPFNVVEIARRASAGSPANAEGARPSAGTDAVVAGLVAGLTDPTRQVLQRVAVAGSAFSTDEFVALAGLPEEQAYAQLDVALAALMIESADSGYQFRHQLVREALLEGLAPHRLAALHRDAAERLAGLGESPARIAHHLIAAGDCRAAVPYVVTAAETEANMGAYRDALVLLDSVADEAGSGDEVRLRMLRGDVLAAMGDRGAVDAYRQLLEIASGDDHRLARARLARAAVMANDLDLAVAAIDGLHPDGGPADPAILLARGNVSYFTGDIDSAQAAADQARNMVVRGDLNWTLLDLVALQGLIAHNRGEWSERLRLELQATRDKPDVAAAVFDSHLCVAEYLLYGPTPYDEVIELAEGLRETARRAGALRAQAFATAVVGEAALLAGDLDRAAIELRDAADLHHEIGAPAGEAHSLQRLAELSLVRGEREEAMRLLQAALPLARWSSISLHLLQRIYGTMIAAAPDPDSALAMVDRAMAALNTNDACPFCNVMLDVPATIACADAGDLERARVHLGHAEESAALWEGTAWQAAILESRAHVAAADGDDALASRLWLEASQVFERAGQPIDADRCRHRLAA
jgi:DNA-binding SARP family transcriptional activator/ATP/maltotriose-dependent transcriptional regulator MalT